MNSVVHFEMPFDDQDRMAKFSDFLEALSDERLTAREN